MTTPLIDEELDKAAEKARISFCKNPTMNGVEAVFIAGARYQAEKDMADIKVLLFSLKFFISSQNPNHQQDALDVIYKFEKTKESK